MSLNEFAHDSTFSLLYEVVLPPLTLIICMQLYAIRSHSFEVLWERIDNVINEYRLQHTCIVHCIHVYIRVVGIGYKVGTFSQIKSPIQNNDNNKSQMKYFSQKKKREIFQRKSLGSDAIGWGGKLIPTESIQIIKVFINTSTNTGIFETNISAGVAECSCGKVSRI